MMQTTPARLGAAVACAGALVVAVAGPARAQEDPAGNNGTVKIDGVEFDSHPDNQPHVGCEFQVDFYGFDEGDFTADVTFEAYPPTAGGELLTDVVDIGEDAAGGGVDLDASATYDLTDALAGIEPHPEQGWHVKLTVNAEGSQGADKKFKVFWVTGCEVTPPTSPTTGPPTSETPTTGPHGTTPPGSVSPSAPTTMPAAVEGELPKTGSNTVPLALSAAGLIGLGGAALYGSRRMRAEHAG